MLGMMIKGKTVAERADKNGGYITGSNAHPANRMPRRVEASAELDDAEGPPNLRDATDEAGSCARCDYYSQRKCEAHNTAVLPGQICDDFSKADGSMGDEDDEGMDSDDD